MTKLKFLKRVIGIVLFMILFVILVKFIRRNFSKTFIHSKIKLPKVVIDTYPFDDDIIEFEKLKHLERYTWAKSINEGYYKPPNNQYRHSFAIVIPNRNRTKNLNTFLDYMHPYLQKQNAEYQIFVIEQANNRSFNKATLMNIGFILTNLHSKVPFNCIIFHDIDVLPVESNVIYRCSNYPYHIGAWINVLDYKLVWDIVGAVFAVTRDQFRKVNGFSNVYEGWGAEDEDMYRRVMQVFKKLDRPPRNQRYIMLPHENDVGNPINKKRFWYLYRAHLRYKKDGLNSTIYNVVGMRKTIKLVNWFRVDFPPVNFSEYEKQKIN